MCCWHMAHTCQWYAVSDAWDAEMAKLLKQCRSSKRSSRSLCMVDAELFYGSDHCFGSHKGPLNLM